MATAINVKNTFYPINDGEQMAFAREAMRRNRIKTAQIWVIDPSNAPYLSHMVFVRDLPPIKKNR